MRIMLCAPMSLLILLLPIESYRHTAYTQHAKNALMIVSHIGPRNIITEVSDREDPSADTSNLLQLSKQSTVQEQQDLVGIAPIRTDIYKAKNLLTKDWEVPNAIKDIRCYLAVNDSFVPVIGVHKKGTFIKLRSFLFGQGVYPGVEYRILNITVLNDKSANSGRKEIKTLQGLLQRGRGDVVPNDDSTGWLSRLFSGQTQLIQTSGGDSSVIIDTDENASIGLTSYREEEDFIELIVRPAYPLIKELEKKWPVKVRLSAVPYVFSRAMYTTVTLLGTLSFALSYFLGSLLLTQVFTLSFVNSRSMTPTILPGDLILVEKVSPVIRRALFHIPPASEGDVVFFSAPPRLLEYIEESNVPVVKKVVKNRLSITGNGIHSDTSNSKTFSKDFLKTRNVLPVIDGDVPTLGPVPMASKESPDRSPFHYKNLRPIGGNTLLVKRLTSISYPYYHMNQLEKSPAIVEDSGLINPKKTLFQVDEALIVKDKENPNKIKKGSLLKVRGINEEKKGPVCLFVRGDNPDVSLDSRQWGCLDEELVMGRPIFTVLPLKRFGFVR